MMVAANPLHSFELVPLPGKYEEVLGAEAAATEAAAPSSPVLREEKGVNDNGGTAWVDESRSDKPAELNGATFTGLQLVNTMIGSGILAMPFVIVQTGLVSAVFLLIVFASVVYVTSICLLDVGEAVGMPTGGFSEVVEKVLGRDWRRATDLACFLSSTGALMSYFNVIGSLGSELLSQVNGPLSLVSTYSGFMIIAVLLLSPMCFLREYGELTPVSSASLGLILVTTLTVGFGRGLSNRHEIPLWPAEWWQPFALLGNFAYATNMQQSVFEACASMRTSERRKMRSSVLGAIIFGACLLIAMGLAGVAAKGQRVESNILASFDQGTALVKVLYVMTVAHLMFYIPNDFIIARLFYFNFKGINILRVPTRTYVTVTSVMILVPLALMASVPARNVSGAFELVIALTGEIPTTFGTTIVPCLLYRSTFTTGRGFFPLPVVNATLGVGLFVIFFAPIITVFDFASSCASKQGCSSYA